VKTCTSTKCQDLGTGPLIGEALENCRYEPSHGGNRLPSVTNLQKTPRSRAKSARSPALQNIKFEREDWTSFRTVEGLQQKAGVAKSRLRRLVLKELTDNGLDNGDAVQIGPLPDGGYFVQDNGSGIDGTPEQIARLFSIARPMISTKLLRLPTRGALGNGLRVVAGAVLASDGSLSVITRNRHIELDPEHADGSTTVVSVEPVDFPVGTRIEISFGLEFQKTTMRCPGGRLPSGWRGRERLIRVSPLPGGTTQHNFTNCFPQAATRLCVN
jgi:hypothetical protein